MNINWQRAVARRFLSLAPCLTVFCAIFCASLISTPAAAQDAKATPSSTIQTQDIVARPIPERTVGLDPGKIVKWTLKDAILAALENNVDIQLEQENVRFVQYDPERMVENVRRQADRAVKQRKLTNEQMRTLMHHYEESLRGYTYLTDD